MAPDGVGEVRHGMSPVLDICRDFAILSDDYLPVSLEKLAPAAGLEPATKRLTAARSTN